MGIQRLPVTRGRITILELVRLVQMAVAQPIAAKL